MAAKHVQDNPPLCNDEGMAVIWTALQNLDATIGTLIGRLNRLDVSSRDFAVTVNEMFYRIERALFGRVDMSQGDDRGTDGDNMLRINHRGHGHERVDKESIHICVSKMSKATKAQIEQGRILTFAGVTMAICSSPVMAFLNLIAIAVWPSWVAIAVSETLRKVANYVVTRPGRELLFTVISQDEKYKAKVCIDVVVQRLGDATAAGMYKLLYSRLNGKTTVLSLYALPVCLLWIATAFHLGRRQKQLAKPQTVSST